MALGLGPPVLSYSVDTGIGLRPLSRNGQQKEIVVWMIAVACE